MGERNSADSVKNGRFGLVFQGPIVSRNPVTSELFDCIPNITRIIRETYDAFDYFVLSTWAGQPEFPLEDRKFLKIYGEDTITGLDRNGFPLNNGPRKIVSSQRGVEALRASGEAEFVLVFRTDTYADLRGFAAAIRSYNQRHDAYRRVDQKSFLHFQYMSLGVPYFATDFFLSGHIDDVFRYLQTNIKHLDIRFRPLKLIDVDWFIKYMYEHLSEHFDYPEYFNFPNIIKRGEVRPGVPVRYPAGFVKYWQDIVYHAVAPMPAAVSTTLEWRGEPKGVSKGPAKRIMLEEWDGVRGRWLDAARERGLQSYDYDDDGAPFDHAVWYMLDRYLVVKGSTYSDGFRTAMVGYQNKMLADAPTRAAGGPDDAVIRQAG